MLSHVVHSIVLARVPQSVLAGADLSKGSQVVGKVIFVLLYSSAHRHSTACNMQKIAVYWI